MRLCLSKQKVVRIASATADYQSQGSMSGPPCQYFGSRVMLPAILVLDLDGFHRLLQAGHQLIDDLA
jgi:hypothetical protein